MNLPQVERVDLLIDLALDTQTAIELITNSGLKPMAYLMLISIYNWILISKLILVSNLMAVSRLIPKMFLRSELILLAKLILDHLVVAEVEVDVEAMTVL